MNSLQRCAGLGQTGWANFSGKLFSVEQCWPDPVILTEIRAAGYVRQARLDHQSNNFTANSAVPGGEAMAKGTTTDFSEQNTESAMQVMDWMRDMTEQSLNQSKSALEGFFTTARKASEDIDEQASELRKRSLLLAQETLSNTFNFAHKIVHARKPQDLFQLQSEFISRQAQVIAEQSKELGQTAVRRAQEVGRTPHQGMAETSRRGPQAA